MSADRSTYNWLDSAEYLPECLRDFHAQKDVFKTIADNFAKRNAERPEFVVNWVSAHVYTIDLFLWWMARHGYTLQRSRKRVPFDSIDDDVRERCAKDAKVYEKALGLTPTTPEAP